MTKRQKFVVTSVILSVLSFAAQFVDPAYRYQTIAGLTLAALVLPAWALYGGFSQGKAAGLSRDATLVNLILPTFFTAGLGIFYFYSLLPDTLIVNWLVDKLYGVPIFLLYALGIYALLLTANIYTFATARTIALLRAAHAVGFFLTLVTSFLLFDAISSLRADFWFNALSVGLVSFPLLLQGFWSIDLERYISREVVFLSLALSLVVAEISVTLSFWPITVSVTSLALTTVVYVVLGLGQAKLQQRLFDKTIREYFLLALIVFVTMFFTARWGG